MFRYSCLQRFIGGGGSGGVTVGGTRICLARQPSLAAERTSSKAILPPYSSSSAGKVTITQRGKSPLKQHSKKAEAGPKSSDATTSANEIPTSLKKKAAQTISSVGVGNTSGIEFVPVGRVPSLEELEPVVASLNEIRAWMHSTLPKKQFVYTLPVDSVPSLSTTTTSKRTTTKGKLSEKVIEQAGNIVEKRVLKHTKVLPDHFFIDSVAFSQESTKKAQGREAELEVVFSIIEPSKKVIKLLDAMKA